MSDSDAQLLRRAREDPDALGELYLRYRDQLYSWFCSRVPQSAASELTAELFAQVALALRRFRDEAGGSAAPWLYGIAKNLVRRYYERGRIETAARQRLGMPIRSYELDLGAVEDRLEAASRREDLARALEALPAGQRDALELRVVAEREYHEVAAELGCSETAARIRVMRALGQLARLLSTLVLAGLAALATAAAGGARGPQNGLISYWTGTGTPAVWVMHPDGYGRRLVFDGTRTASGPRENFDLEIVRLDGTGRRWLTRGRARDTDADWSPDGRTIVFQRRLGAGSSSIWTVSSSGRAERRLGRGTDPSFSPSGRRIAFARHGDVYSMRSDGTDVRRLRDGQGDAYPSGWSPNGRQILFTVFSKTAHRAAVWVMRADGTGARRLTQGGYDVAAAWSPDGKRILFTRIVRSTTSERGIVAVMRADGTHMRTLTRRAADEYATSWQAVH